MKKQNRYSSDVKKKSLGSSTRGASSDSQDKKQIENQCSAKYSKFLLK